MNATLITTLLLFGLAGSPADASATGDGLVAALHDTDPDIRALAAVLLADEAEQPETGATAALTARLADRSEIWRVRVAAAEALAQQDHRDAGVTQRLVDVVLESDEDWRVRAAALSAARARDGGLLLSRALAVSGDVRISNGHSSVSLKAPLADSTIFDALTDPDERMRSLARAALDSGIELADQRSGLTHGSPCFSEVLSQVLSQTATTTGTLTLY